MDMGFSDLYEMYEDFKLDRAQTTPTDFEYHLMGVREHEELLDFKDWVQENHAPIYQEYLARS